MNVAEIQEVATDELKKVQKEEFLAFFSETVQLCKSMYICQLSLFKKKRYVSLI